MCAPRRYQQVWRVSRPARRSEFGLASGRRGPQALSLKLIDPPPTLSSRPRRRGSGRAQAQPGRVARHGRGHDHAAGGHRAARAAQGPLSGPQDRPQGLRGRQGRGQRTGLLNLSCIPDTSLQRELYLLIYFSNVCAVAEIPFCFFRRRVNLALPSGSHARIPSPSPSSNCSQLGHITCVPVRR